MIPKYPHIILIVLDTAGAKHMSLYGYHRRTTPELERLASQATLYTRCFAPGCWTIPSHASMFTGLYPSEHGVDGYNTVLDENYQHIVSILHHRGYRTYGISCNGLVSPLYGNCRDFDVFREYGVMGFAVQRLRIKDEHTQELFKKFLSEAPNRWVKLRLFLEHMVQHKDLGVLTTLIKRGLTELLPVGSINHSTPYTRRSFHTALKDIQNHLRTAPGTPFFMFVNVVQTHAYYNPPKDSRRFSRPTDKQTLFTSYLHGDGFGGLREEVLPVCQNLYDDEVLFVDRVVGQFWDQLQSLGILDHTLVIVTSDHGEHFGEKGYYEHELSLFNELIWVPLLIHFPDGYGFAGPDDRLVSLNDLFATLLDVSHSPFPCPRHSQSLLSSVRRDTVSAMILDNLPFKIKIGSIVNQSKEWAEALPAYKYALILENGPKLLEKENGQVEIYDLTRDPEESQDLSAVLAPSVCQDLLALLAEDKRLTGFEDDHKAYPPEAVLGQFPEAPHLGAVTGKRGSGSGFW